jgi:DNA-binding transcriptional MerR regulator
MSMAFDTLKFSHRLQQVGVSLEQAEAHAELARDMVIAELATKAGLGATSKDLQAEIKGVSRDLQAEIKDVRAELSRLEQRMTIRLGAMLAAAVGIVAAQKLI